MEKAEIPIFGCKWGFLFGGGGNHWMKGGAKIMGSGKRLQHRLIQSTLVTVILLAACSLMAATKVKLSGTMSDFGDVTEFQISRDSRYAVYLADQDTDGVNELYSVQLASGLRNRLNPLLPSGRAVSSFKISPDSQRVIYIADQETDNVFELYSIPITGPPGSVIKINGPMVSSVFEFEISPDSNRVVYRADQYTRGIHEIFSVPIEGPATSVVKLNGPITSGGYVYSFQICFNSSHVVYLSDQETYGVFEVYSVPIAGPAAAVVKLNGPLVTDGSVEEFMVSPDSNRVVYRADQLTKTNYELFSVPIAGPAAAGIKLNGLLASMGDVNDFRISPDSKRVVYRANQDTQPGNELYSVPIAGPAGAGVMLNGPLLASGNVYVHYKISPDSRRVVYRADQQTDEVYELYSVPIEGPATSGVKLNDPLVLNGDLALYEDDVQISSDSLRVVYRADQQTDEVYELYSVPIEGPATSGVKLNGPLVLNGDVTSYKISPDSRRVVYRADQQTDEVYELYSVPIEGPATSGVKLNDPPVANGDVYSFLISKDSGRVIYIADQDTDEILELYLISDFRIYLPLVP